MRNNQAKVVQAALPIAVRFITEKTGVEVLYGPFSTASTDLKSIRIPLLNDSETARTLGLGYALHEAYHIKETESLDLLKGMKGLAMGMFQILEDNRIELRASSDFVGGNQVLRDLALLLMDKADKSKPKTPAQAVFSAAYTFLEASRFTGQSFLDRKKAAWEDLEEIFNGVPSIPDRLEILLSRADRLRSTTDARALALAIVSMIEEEKEKLQNQQPDSESEDESEDEDQGQQPDSESEDESEDEDQGQQPDSVDDGNGSKEAINMIDELLSEEVSTQERDDEIKQLMNQNVNEDGANQFFPAAVHKQYGTSRDEGMLAGAQRISSQMRRRLKQYLESSTWEDRLPTSTGRKLSARKLSQVATGQSRVFDKRIDGEGIDTAVLFLIDRSGSMCHQIDIAAQAALAAALAVESNQGCSVQVTAFPYDCSDSVMEITKFGQKVADSSNIYRVLGVDGGTPLAPAMIYGLQEMAIRQEQRKIIIAITDGAPECRISCEKAYELGKQMGVEFIGIGINTDVDWLFENSRGISSVDELPKCMFEVLKASMLASNLHF
ncbi:MAG: VWA domain-containing protein [Halothiobacillus sp.]|jgi:cobalamin biosynthesis protein CobT|nr:VWA domain-containing protein [Halothiobacillus sp.]